MPLLSIDDRPLIVCLVPIILFSGWIEGFLRNEPFELLPWTLFAFFYSPLVLLAYLAARLTSRIHSLLPRVFAFVAMLVGAIVAKIFWEKAHFLLSGRDLELSGAVLGVMILAYSTGRPTNPR